MTKLGIVVGSIRRNSLSQQLGQNIVNLFPEVYASFRETVKALDAVVFITPEHNRSVPAALKNALDVGSRPYGSSVWNGKPALIVSQSSSNLNGFGANHHLRQVLAFLNMPVVQQSEVYIANVHELLGEGGKITNQDTIGFLQSAVDAHVSLIKKHQG